MSNIKDDFAFFKNNENIVYLDNAATTQKPNCTIEVMDEYYKKYNTNLFRSVNKLSNHIEKEYYKAKNNIALYIGTTSDRIAFTYNATDSLNMIAEIITNRYGKDNGNIIISSLEHHSNILPWIKYCDRYGYNLRYIPLCENGDLDYSKISDLIDDKTICLSITGASNVNGNITDLEMVSNICQKNNIPLVLDLTQLVSHQKLNLNSLKYEYAAFSSHKMYGPLGLGILVCGTEDACNQIGRVGGGVVDDVFDFSFERKIGTIGYEAGTQNISSIVGLSKTIEYLNSNNDIFKKENELKESFENYLKTIDDIRIVKHGKNSLPIVSFNFDFIHSSDANMILDKMGILIRSGKFCAYKAMKELKENSALRVSFGIYNDESDLNKLIEGIEYIKKKYDKS